MPRPARAKNVYIFSPGGRTAAGGMAKIVDYTVRGWPTNSKYRLRIVDTFGTGGRLRMPFYFIAALLTLIWGLLTRDVDIVHLNMSERLSVWRKMLLGLIAYVFRVPVILHLHGADFADYFLSLGALRRAVVKSFMGRCKKVLVLGTFWRDFVVREIGLDPRSVRILHNAVPAAPNRQPSPRRDGCRFLFLGVVGERKGIDVLLEAMALPALNETAWDAVIAGNGEVDRYQRDAERRGLINRVRFIGQIGEDAVHAELSCADVLVMPSRNEGLPVAIIEAMSFGCAIVATEVGSIADAVLHEETGLLVKAGNAADLAAALSRLARDRDLRSLLGAGAKARFKACFSLSNYVNALEAVFDEATVSL